MLATDLVLRFDPREFSGWRGLLMRLDGLVGAEGSTPREWRASFWNRRAAREARRKALDWKPRRLVMAHGECAHENGGEVLARALAWMG